MNGLKRRWRKRTLFWLKILEECCKWHKKISTKRCNTYEKNKGSHYRHTEVDDIITMNCLLIFCVS